MARSNNEAKQEDQNSAAGEVIASSQDLTTEILLRLPAKSVANSKYVSKQWLSVTSDPDFIRSHILHHYPRSPSGLFLHYLARPRALACKYVPLDQQAHHPSQFVESQNSLGLNILQSCNGLLLCSVSDTEYYICNPTTLQRKKLVLPEGFPCVDFMLNLAFDPKKSPHYKVISIRRCLGLQKYQLEVYSSESGQWKTPGEPFVEYDVIDFKRGVFSKGAVHWLKTSSSCLYFDVVNESMSSTPEPLIMPYAFQSHEYFGQCNGRLYIIVKWPWPNFMLFEMKEDYSGWFKKCVVDVYGLATKYLRTARNFYNRPRIYPEYDCNVLCIAQSGRCRNDDKNGVEIVLSMPGGIVIFNPQTKASKKITGLVLQPHDTSAWYDFLVHEYYETLCSV